MLLHCTSVGADSGIGDKTPTPPTRHGKYRKKELHNKGLPAWCFPLMYARFENAFAFFLIRLHAATMVRRQASRSRVPARGLTDLEKGVKRAKSVGKLQKHLGVVANFQNQPAPVREALVATLEAEEQAKKDLEAAALAATPFWQKPNFKRLMTAAAVASNVIGRPAMTWASTGNQLVQQETIADKIFKNNLSKGMTEDAARAAALMQVTLPDPPADLFTESVKEVSVGKFPLAYAMAGSPAAREAAKKVHADAANELALERLKYGIVGGAASLFSHAAAPGWGPAVLSGLWHATAYGLTPATVPPHLEASVEAKKQAEADFFRYNEIISQNRRAALDSSQNSSSLARTWKSYDTDEAMTRGDYYVNGLNLSTGRHDGVDYSSVDRLDQNRTELVRQGQNEADYRARNPKQWTSRNFMFGNMGQAITNVADSLGVQNTTQPTSAEQLLQNTIGARAEQAGISGQSAIDAARPVIDASAPLAEEGIGLVQDTAQAVTGAFSGFARGFYNALKATPTPEPTPEPTPQPTRKPTPSRASTAKPKRRAKGRPRRVLGDAAATRRFILPSRRTSFPR